MEFKCIKDYFKVILVFLGNFHLKFLYLRIGL